MIDIENKVFDVISNKVNTSFLSQYPDLECVSDYISSPSSFPCVSFYEMDNYVNTSSSTLNEIENHAVILYSCDIYANNETKKSLCKSIANVIDEEMKSMGFTRVFKEPIPNIDRSIYRIKLRWRGIVSKGIQKGNNTVHYVY